MIFAALKVDDNDVIIWFTDDNDEDNEDAAAHRFWQHCSLLKQASSVGDIFF